MDHINMTLPDDSNKWYKNYDDEKAWIVDGLDDEHYVILYNDRKRLKETNNYIQCYDNNGMNVVCLCNITECFDISHKKFTKWIHLMMKLRPKWGDNMGWPQY